MAATTEEVPRPYGRGTSSVVSFVVAMNRVDVVDLVVDLVDVDLDIDLVDVDLDVDLVDVGLVDVVPAVFLFFGLRLYFWLLAPGCISGFWPPAVFGALAPGCSGCFRGRLFFGLPCSLVLSPSLGAFWRG